MPNFSSKSPSPTPTIMRREQLSFKNNYQLYFRDELDDLFKADQSALQEKKENWAAEGISQLILYTDDSVQEKSLQSLEKKLAGGGLEIRTVSLARFVAEDFEYIRSLNRKLLQALNHGSSLMVYSPSSESVVASHLVTLLVSLQVSKTLNPQRAIEYLTGRKESIPDDLLIHRYMHAVDPSYDIPANMPKIVTEKQEATPVAEVAASSLEQVVDPTPAKKKDEPAIASANTDVDARADADAAAPTSGFKLSRFTIKVKMLGIISSIIVAAMSLVIFLASYWFRGDMEVLVQKNNIDNANAIGGKAEADFKRVASNARLLAQSPISAMLSESFFTDNPEIIFVGIAARRDRELVFRKKIYNREYLKANRLGIQSVEKLHGLHGRLFLKSFNGAVTAENITPGFTQPILGVSRLYAPGEILLIYVDAAGFLKYFGGEKGEEKLVSSFMVNASGDVIAHPDSKMVLSRTSLANLEIVKEMLKSKVASGLKQYTDEKGRKWMGSYARFNFGSFGVVSTVLEERVFENVNRLQNRNILILVVAVNIALLIVYYFSKTLTSPIANLVSATREVEAGRYDLGMKILARDELGLLTSSFVSMAHGLDEREKMKDAFGKFVNKEIAERAMRGELQLGGEKKECAIFFSDLRGFTAMSEGMTPEAVVDFLNEYFTGMVRCVNETNGVVDKFIGDAVMAHWGALMSSGNDTENAVNSALMMRTTLIEFNKRGAGKRPIARIGCGINSGPVIAGQIGSDERLEFTVIGDAVNLASRIEALNKPFGTDVLISDDSRRLVEGIYHLEEMPAIMVKGKSEPQKIFAVLGRNDDANAPQNLDELRKLADIEFDSSKQKAGVPEGGEVKYEILES